RMSYLHRGSGLVLVALAAFSLTGCKTQEPEPFSPRASQENERAHASEIPMRPVRPLPTTLESPYLTSAPTTEATAHPPATGPAIETSPIRRMSLRELVHRAVANNLDVKVSG